ncbi:MAG: AraC family transcriptional regulator [Pseudomonadales bacterium]|nr:AraC family transcriptional regulator [Pseudomonadales bacterium]
MSGRTIPARLVLLLLQGAKRGGARTEELLEAVGIPIDVLSQPDARIEKQLFTQLMVEVMHRTQDEFMGFGEGRVSKPGTFSMMAHAVINCASLEKAILRGAKFYELFNYSIFSRLVIEDDEATLRYMVREKVDFQSYVLEAVIFLSIRFLSWLIGQQIVPKKICFDFPCEDDGDFASQFSCPVFYNQSHTAIVLDKRYMQMPLVQNSLSLSKFLRSSLQELMDGDIESASLNARIRSIISKEFGNNFPDFSVICEKLNMTPQTLRRRLKDENTSYQEIKDSIRKDASIFYLSKHELTIDEIAMLMGFSEASSFHRAFKKWTGKTPSVYRQELMQQAGG